MNAEQLKAQFRRVLLGAAAPLVISGCSPNFDCQPKTTRFVFGDAGIPSTGYAHCVDVSADAGQAAADCPQFCGGGRAPPGLVQASPRPGPGEYVARMAWLEAASVGAFRRLAHELAGHGAPAELVAQARVSARDEVRHARVMTALARRHGARPPRVVVKHVAARSLLELALDNAREGCVNEAFGALIGLYQAEHAEAAGLREAMAEVAADEVAHAAFSLELDAWLASRLTADERQQVEAARAAAFDALLADLMRADVAGRAALGLPPPEVAARLAEGFRATVARA